MKLQVASPFVGRSWWASLRASALSLALAASASPAFAQDGERVAAPERVAVAPADPAAVETEEKPDPVSVKLVWSQFADLPVAGDAADIVRYGGKADLYLGIKGSTVGLDDSIELNLHPEFRYGEAANGAIGLLPSNSALFYPDDDGEQFDLSVNVTKTWQNGTSLTVGKVNVLDLAAQLPITGGGGIEGFQNLAYALPPSAIVPGSITGALLSVPTKKALLRVWVFDPDIVSQRSGFDDLFGNGVGMLASVTVPVKIGGRTGYYALKLAGSTRSNIAARSLPPVLVPAPGSGFGDGRGEFAAILAGSQYISGGPGDPAGGIGIFGQVYVSAGDPTFLDVSGQFGITGNPPGRPQDRFGLGWYRYSLTDGLVDALAARVALEDEEGIEAFYTFGLSQRFRFTANLQVIDSAVVARDTGVLAGLRLVTVF